MRALWLRLRLSNPIFRSSPNLYSSSSSPPLLNSLPSHAPPSASSVVTNLFAAPWTAFQSRGIKVAGSDIRVGNLIGKQGRIYEVIKVEHSHEGRGKATIKVELRDIAQGNKVTQRMGTSENIERVYAQEKPFMYMCMDHDGTVVLMDPDTLDQIEVSKELFGKSCVYLQDGMKVKVQFYDDKPLSASVPIRVTCTVKEEIGAYARSKKVVLENGLTVEVPPHVVAGDAIVINTQDDSYIERAKA